MLSPLGPAPSEIVRNLDGPRWRLGPALIDLEAGLVSRDGCEHRLERSGAALLAALIAHRGQTLGKEPLLAAGWPGRVVSENSLAKAISRLRQALGDERGELLRVVHGYGYRLAASVTPEPEDSRIGRELPEPTQDARPLSPRVVQPGLRHGLNRALRRSAAVVALLLAFGLSWLLAGAPDPDLPDTDAARAAAGSAAAGKAAGAQDVIALLPLTDLSPGGALGPLALGIAERLRIDMQRMPAVRVVDRGSAEAAASAEFDPEALESLLGANLLVGGELSGDVSRPSVLLRLHDTRGRIPSRVQRFEPRGAEPEALMQALSGWLIESIGSQPQRWGFDAEGGRGTPNEAAYRAFLRASTLFGGNNDPNSQRRALAVLEQALALDGGYVDALHMQGGILGGSGYYADSAEQLRAGRQRALQVMDRVIALAPDHLPALLERSEMRLLYRFDAVGSTEDLQAAKALAATDATLLARVLVWEARLLASTATLQQAIEVGERAAALDPRSGALRNLGWHYLAHGDTANARRVLRAQLVDLPESPHVNFYLALCEILDGRSADALPWLEHSSTLFRLVGTAIAQHELGNREASELALRNLKNQFGIADGYWAGAVHAFRGEAEPALHWLERALTGGDSSVMYMPFDPLLARLRGDPRLDALIARLRVPVSAPEPAG